MKSVTTLFLLAVAAVGIVTGRAEKIMLETQTGEAFGPFDLEKGGRVRIADRDYTLHVQRAGEDDLRRRLERIIIPSIDFRQANIHDVVALRQEASIE